MSTKSHPFLHPYGTVPALLVTELLTFVPVFTHDFGAWFLAFVLLVVHVVRMTGQYTDMTAVQTSLAWSLAASLWSLLEVGRPPRLYTTFRVVLAV